MAGQLVQKPTIIPIDLAPLYVQGLSGTGQTNAIVDSYGSDTIAHDLHVYDRAFALQPMCGEEGVTCTPGMPTFTRLALQGAPEDYVMQNHLAQVISQSFGAAKESFNGVASLLNLRHTYVDAAQNGVTVLAASGDGGSGNTTKEPVGKGGSLIPYPTVGWPASDPLVTAVGGNYLCTDPNAATIAPRTLYMGPPAGPNYAADFYDITVGNNQAYASVAGYPATTGWDPVTGLGTPNAANLIPDLVTAMH